MSKKPEWKIQFEQELHRAEEARVAGNEGMARVCARRAVGIAIGEYLRQRGISPITQSAYDRIKDLNRIPEIPEQVKDIANHFLTRVTTDHTLPIDADLVAEARWLTQKLNNRNTHESNT